MLVSMFVMDDVALCFRINLGTPLCTLLPGKVILTLWKCCWTRVSIYPHLIFSYIWRNSYFFIWMDVKPGQGKRTNKAPEKDLSTFFCISHAQRFIFVSFSCLPICSFYFFSVSLFMFASDARIDIRNNENKLALEMATNAQCASLLKRKQGSSKYSCSYKAATHYTHSHTLTGN